LAVFRGKLFYNKEKSECDVAIKQYPTTKFKEALHEIINNARLFESHPNVVGLRAV
jgi:hypothetical protein